MTEKSARPAGGENRREYANTRANPTIRDVARASNVSIGTVSKALNNIGSLRQETSIGGTDWGMLQAGITISIIPCVLFYLLLQKYYVSGFTSGAVK